MEQTRTFIEEAIQTQTTPRSSYILAATLAGQVIGSAAVWTTSQTDRNGELGYTFSREHWGQGFGTEATKLLITVGFTVMGLERVTATCHPNNVASARVLEKSGFVFEGRLRSEKLVRGIRRDSLLFSTLKSDFQAFG